MLVRYLLGVLPFTVRPFMPRSIGAMLMLILLSLQPLSAKWKVEDSVRTVGGTVKILRDRDNYITALMLNRRVIKRFDVPFLSIEKRYRMPHSTVLILVENAGGSGTVDEYHILEVFPNGKTILTRGVDSWDGTYEVKRVGNDIEIYLGYEKGRKKYARYHNGKLKIRYLSSHPSSLDSYDCRWLYKWVYYPYVKESNCRQEIPGFIGNGTFHGYYAILQSPVIDRASFERFARHSCRRRHPLSYRAFATTVCRGKIREAENRIR